MSQPVSLRPQRRHRLGLSSRTSSHFSLGNTTDARAWGAQTEPRDCVRTATSWAAVGVGVLRAGRQRRALGSFVEPHFQFGNLGQRQANYRLGLKRLSSDRCFRREWRHAQSLNQTHPCQRRAKSTHEARTVNPVVSEFQRRKAIAIPRGISGVRQLAPLDDPRIPPCRRREPVGSPRERSCRPRRSPS